MTDPTTPPFHPCPGPCAAVRSEDPAVYGAGAAPESSEAERLDRLDRGGPDALSAGSLAAFLLPPGVVRLLIAANRDATGRRAAASLEARVLAQGIAATVLSPEGGDFNDDLTALGPQALAARLGHGTM